MAFQMLQNYCVMIILADDTSVFIEGHEYSKMTEILNNEMMKIDTWLE